MSAFLKRKATPKQYVLKKLPRAFASHRLKHGYWRVYPDSRKGWNQVIVGIGDTASQAWADAASFLRRYGG